MSSYNLIELCCGSAAFTWHMLGATKSLMPYQGSKWRYRELLEETARSLNFTGTPRRIGLYDVGYWPNVHQQLFMSQSPSIWAKSSRDHIINVLEDLDGEDPKVVYDQLTRYDPLVYNLILTISPASMAAYFLFLQRLAFSGKAVSWCGRELRWKSPGFNNTSAYGTLATGKFGRVKPMIPSLIRRIKQLPQIPEDINITCRIQDALSVKLPRITRPTLVYIDPPYKGTTKYPDGDLTRTDVINLAREWHSHSPMISVIVSEAEPIEELQGTFRQIAGSKTDRCPFKSKRPEWLTILE